ncbi:MAG: biotin--[acetyl-CoA-carboxylase] ligase [Oscillospiraceae bacterium]|nr:biotin--[acetyl-CoA-carboxylase] ligase [Oscillospiraceae bacterium]
MERIALPPEVTIVSRETIVSTNAELIALAKSGAAELTLLTAKTQSGGHGQHGRTFFSPPGGAYFSLLLRPEICADIAEQVTVTAAVAACEAVKAVFGVTAGIKPVNDIIINGKKAAGILAEAFDGADGFFVVLGVGANLTVPAGGFPAELPNAGSVTGLSAGALPANAFDDFIAETVTRFLTHYRGADIDAVRKKYNERLVTQ